MSGEMQKIVESKRAMRKQLAALPFAEKIKLLEQLRDRALTIAASRLHHPLAHRGLADSILPELKLHRPPD